MRKPHSYHPYVFPLFPEKNICVTCCFVFAPIAYKNYCALINPTKAFMVQQLTRQSKATYTQF